MNWRFRFKVCEIAKGEFRIFDKVTLSKKTNKEVLESTEFQCKCDYLSGVHFLFCNDNDRKLVYYSISNNLSFMQKNSNIIFSSADKIL